MTDVAGTRPTPQEINQMTDVAGTRPTPQEINQMTDVAGTRPTPQEINQMTDVAGTRPTPQEINEMVREAFPGSGNECTELGPDYAIARRTVLPDNVRPGGFISGPTQFALADAALWYVVFAAIGRVEPMAMTSELSIRFLRPAVGEVLWARGTLEAAGRRNVVGTVHLWTDDRPHKPTSIAQGTYVLPV